MTHVATGSFHSPKAATTFICHGLRHKTRMEVLWSLLSPPSITSHERWQRVRRSGCMHTFVFGCTRLGRRIGAIDASTTSDERGKPLRAQSRRLHHRPPDLDPAHPVRLPEHHLAARRPPTGGVTAVSSAPGGGTGVAGPLGAAGAAVAPNKSGECPVSAAEVLRRHVAAVPLRTSIWTKDAGLWTFIARANFHPVSQTLAVWGSLRGALEGCKLRFC